VCFDDVTRGWERAHDWPRPDCSSAVYPMHNSR
jgi:hypothetical protein